MNNSNFKIKSRKEKGSRAQFLSFEGDLNIKNSFLIKKRMEAIKITGDPIRFHLSQVEDLDLTFIQLMYSFIDLLRSKGKEIAITSDLTEDMQKILINAGFKELTD